jgi:hypothetical protein
VVETSLPDEGEHRRRVEERTAGLPGHRVPTWDEARDGPRTVVDTTDSYGALTRTLALLADDDG